jgi:hypothetical protein
MREAQSRRLDVLLDVLAGATPSDIVLLDQSATLIDRLLRAHAAEADPPQG